MTVGNVSGHRQRLRDRFMAGEESSRTDQTLLELLLTYAIPQKDVRPLAQNLIAHFGNLSGVLRADVGSLREVDGIQDHTAALIKLVDWIRIHFPAAESRVPERHWPPTAMQASLFQESLDRSGADAHEIDVAADEPEADEPGSGPAPAVQRRPSRPSRGTGLFGKAVLKEAIDLLPRLPDTEDLTETREFLRNNLHYSAEQTRVRYADYIIRRMFPDGYADIALRSFARHYAGRQELRDACFYRFCTVEPVMHDIVDELLLPAIGTGRLARSQIRSYLTGRFPSSKSIVDYAKAITDAFADSGVAHADRQKMQFSYREVLLPSGPCCGTRSDCCPDYTSCAIATLSPKCRR